MKRMNQRIARKTYLKLFFILCFSCFWSYKGYCLGRREVIDVSAFGAGVDDGRDDTRSLREAVKKARQTPGSTLYFPAGRYLISDPKAIQIQQDALTGKLGANPQDELYVHNNEYVIGLDFVGAKDLKIEADGAELLCDGWMEPVSFRNAENITLNGLTIDYKRPANSAGKIINMGKDYVDVKFAAEDPVDDKMIMIRIMIYDENRQSLVGPAVYHKTKELIAPQTMRFYGTTIRQQAELGRVLMVWSGFHYRPAILIYKTRNITLNDVTIHSQAGMGIVGHLSEDIALNRLKVVPRRGRYISSNTDATHFATNRGYIRFVNCEFEGQGDDATNVHNYYAHIVSRSSDNVCETFLGEKNPTHSSYQDEPMAGDILAVVKKSTLEEAGYIKVRRFWANPETRRVKIEFDGYLPDNTEDYYLANMTACPQLEFLDSRVKSHRARSVLVKTRRVRIEGNSFENTTGTAIHIGAEGDWGEGVASEDVVVKNNTFTNCGLGGADDGTIDDASAIAVHVKAPKRDRPGLHKRLLFEGNEISGGIHAITIKNAEDVIIRNNVFTDMSEAPVVVGASRRVHVYNNKGAEDFRVGGE